MASIPESVMNCAGRTSCHPFADLRSARRAKNRTRARNEKYNNFKDVTRNDLLSSSNQQQHYVPTECVMARVSIKDGFKFYPIYPGDPSTAPVAKFTKREAYKVAQRTRTPKNDHWSEKKDGVKWQRRTALKKAAKRGLFDKEYVGDIYWENYEETCLSWLDKHDRYCMFRQYQHVFESCDDDIMEADEGYQSDDGNSDKESYEVWRWHRNFVGGWFRSNWNCMWSWCDCFSGWNEQAANEPRSACSLDEWLDRGLIEGSDGTWDSKDCDPWDVQCDEDRDWDIVSATSEAWTEIAEFELED